MAERQLVVFRLGAEHYGVGIDTVREIITQTAITPMPESPPHMEGVINLRGQVVPVVNLGRRLALHGDGGAGRIIVLEVGESTVGCVVDSVDEVLRVDEDIIQPATHVSGMAADYVTGIAKLEDRLVILLDPGQVLQGSVPTSAELMAVTGAAEAAAAVHPAERP